MTAPWCPSPWILIDTTPPTPGVAIVLRSSDDAYLEKPPDAAYQFSTEWVYITLRDFYDFESGIYAYYVTLIRPDGCPITLEQRFAHSLLIQFRVPLTHMQSLRVRVRTLNFAGLTSDVRHGLPLVE